VIEKATSKLTGWCGLRYNPDKDEYDIGFRFFRVYWNQGHATETAKRCIDYGFKEQGIQRITRKAMKENISSMKVLEKIGMTYKDTFHFDGQEGVLYGLTNKHHEMSSTNRPPH
jgi:ribosomal-protein-alanine N-acetyltransferase